MENEDNANRLKQQGNLLLILLHNVAQHCLISKCIDKLGDQSY